MLARIPLRTLNEWRAYFGVAGPSGEHRMDWRFAQQCALMANINRGKGTPAYKLKDFMPEFGSTATSVKAHKERSVALMKNWAYQHSATARKLRKEGKK